MADGRAKAEWGRTSSLMALLANCHRSEESRPAPYLPSDFDPTGKKPVPAKPAAAAEEGPKITMRDLKPLIVKASKKRKG